MEARKITVISTRNNKRTVINSNATTLGELKRDLRSAGIDYTDMTFYEGLTKTELKMDESLLPHDVQRVNRSTGEMETTNELAFMLTNTNKKIRSGRMTRNECYSVIKSLGLQETCKSKFGRNYTMCKTEDLEGLIESCKVKKTSGSKKPVKDSCTKTDGKKPESFVDEGARAAVKYIAGILYEEGHTDDNDNQTILGFLSGDIKPCCLADSTESPYTDEEIDDMFAGM